MTRGRRVRRWVIDWPARIALAVVVVLANVGGAAVVYVLEPQRPVQHHPPLPAGFAR
jgi:hypothetical protein